MQDEVVSQEFKAWQYTDLILCPCTAKKMMGLCGGGTKREESGVIVAAYCHGNGCPDNVHIWQFYKNRSF